MFDELCLRLSGSNTICVRDFLADEIHKRTYPLLSPLTVAVHAGQLKVVECLLAHGSDATHVDASDISPYERGLLKLAVAMRKADLANKVPSSARIEPAPNVATVVPDPNGVAFNATTLTSTLPSLTIDTNLPTSAPPIGRGALMKRDSGAGAPSGVKKWGRIREAVYEGELDDSDAETPRPQGQALHTLTQQTIGSGLNTGTGGDKRVRMARESNSSRAGGGRGKRV